MRSAAPDRPDILLIVSDDHGYADRSARGSWDARTPHLDRLAREGMVFDQGYVTAPICSPSRAGLIAGAHQQRWGANWFDTSAFPPPQQPVMPEVLQQAGYRTGYFGKVHYGPERPEDRACPENHGFDESLYGLAGLSMGRLHYLHHSHAAADEYGEAAPAHGVDPLRENGREVECEQHLTVEHTDIGNGLSLVPMGAQPSPGGCPYVLRQEERGFLSGVVVTGKDREEAAGRMGFAAGSWVRVRCQAAVVMGAPGVLGAV